jgi:uncharacterized RDD family membrane protein YckC
VSLEDRYVTETPEGVSLDITLAGLGSRLAAYSLDFTVQVTVFVLVLLAVAAVVSGDGETGTLVVTGTALALFVLVFIGYFVICEMLFSGRSLGKLAAGTRVVRVGGGAVTFTSSLLRNVARIVDWLPSLYCVGILAILVSTNNQRLGDMLGGTLVIRVRHAADRRDSFDNVARFGATMVQAASDLHGHGLSDELAAWDASSVTDAEIALVRSFLARRYDYAAPARERLARDLAGRLRPRVAGVTVEYADEPFLERLSMVNAARRS